MKNKLFLAIITFISIAVYVLFVEFQLPNKELSENIFAYLQAFSQIGLLIVLFMCFILKPGFALLASITVFSSLAAFAYPESIYSFFPLLMHLWFFSLIKNEEHRLYFFIMYYIILPVSIILGILLSVNKNVDRYFSVALSTIFSVLLFLMCVIFGIEYFKHKNRRGKILKQKLKTNKTGNQSFAETNVAIFFFFEISILILNVLYYINADWNSLFTVGTFFVRIMVIIYILVNMYYLFGKKEKMHCRINLKDIFENE